MISIYIIDIPIKKLALIIFRYNSHAKLVSMQLGKTNNLNALRVTYFFPK